MHVVVGEPIPLALKLFDDSPIETVNAYVYTSKGDRYQVAKLFHLESGLYINNDTPMPNVDAVIVAYKVENTDKYADVAETFCSTAREEDQWIYGQVEETSKRVTDAIDGVIYETSNKE